MKASVVKTRGTFRHVIWSCGREQELSKQLDVSSVSSIKMSILEGSEIGDRQRGNKYYFRFRLKGWSYLPRMGAKDIRGTSSVQTGALGRRKRDENNERRGGRRHGRRRRRSSTANDDVCSSTIPKGQAFSSSSSISSDDSEEEVIRAVERLGTWAEYANELIRIRWGFQHSGREWDPSSVHFSDCDFSMEHSSIMDTRLVGPFLLSVTGKLFWGF